MTPTTPESVPSGQVAMGSYGSLEKGISGNYQFEVGTVIKEGWERTKGSKGQFWLALLAYIGVYFAVSVFLMFVFRMLGAVKEPHTGSEIALAAIQQFLLIATTLPMSTGLYMLGVKKAVDQPIPVSGIFQYFGKAVPLLLTMILLYIMVIIGFILLVIPGIYLLVSYYFALPLVVDKNLSPWDALEASRKAVSKRWFAVFGFTLLILLIVLVSMIPLGIGVIWTFPFAIIAYGVLYRNIFGYEGAKAG